MNTESSVKRLHVGFRSPSQLTGNICHHVTITNTRAPVMLAHNTSVCAHPSSQPPSSLASLHPFGPACRSSRSLPPPRQNKGQRILMQHLSGSREAKPRCLNSQRDTTKRYSLLFGSLWKAIKDLLEVLLSRLPQEATGLTVK